MNHPDVVSLVSRFESNYRQLATPDLINEWARAFARVEVGEATTAADLVVEAETFFPSVATFRRYLTAVTRATPKQSAGCGQCEGSRWVNGPSERGVTFPSQTYETVRPCQVCAPEAYERWRFAWSKEARQHRRNADEAVYEIHPDVARGKARELRDFLAEVPDLLKHANDLAPIQGETAA